MKKVMITGAAGYIGSVLTAKLLERGYAVRAIDRFFFGREAVQPSPLLEICREDSRRIDPVRFRDLDAVFDLVSISNDPSAELFEPQTWAINCDSRVRSATLAKMAGVPLYVLASSASIYGWSKETVREESPINPLTVYARANRRAEEGVLALADDTFTVVVLRQATVFGLSPRMRFDLAVNGMSYGAWKTGILPLMRDGNQCRPMVHIQDTTDLMTLLMNIPGEKINGQIFNVGADHLNFVVAELAHCVHHEVERQTGRAVTIEWYGDPDHRSYRLDCGKVTARLGWSPKRTVVDGVREIVAALETGQIDRTDRTLTLEWYRQLTDWHRRIREVELYDGILDIE